MRQWKTVPHGRKLYRLWREKLLEERLGPEWQDFWAFYDWVREAGWVPGCRIQGKLGEKLSPDTCRICPPREQHFGTASPCRSCQEGLACMGLDCPQWRDWFRNAWDEAALRLRESAREGK